MKTILLAFLISTFGCKCSKTNTAKNNITPGVVVAAQIKDTIAPLPLCINKLIEKMKAEPLANPPMKIYSYTFQNKTVYYVQGPCCDNFSDLYNDSCKIIAHPDGGFTGRGDGTMPTFHDDKKNEKLVWEDKRKK
jgi:hypothetical protein